MPTLTTNGVDLNYLREGGGPPVLLVHGYLFGADFWRPQIDALTDRFEVIAPDLRGQMASQTTDEDAGYDLWNQAEDMHGLISALGIAPVHYVGLSMGGFIGMRLALNHPEDVRSLVLMDTTSEPEEDEKRERYEAMRGIVEAGELERVTPALPSVFFVDDYIAEHPDEVEAWLDRLRAADHMGIVRAGRVLDAREDISDRLGAIDVPTLVIHGTEDVAIPLERAERLAAAIRGARLETIRAGHQSNVDRPEETSRLIRDFLEAVSGAG
jgi:pimeloyl-ACP methyl ester carboxylesterase